MKEVERGGGQSGGLQESAERARGVPLRYRVFAHALFRQHAEYRRGHDDHAVGLLFSHGRAVLLAHCVVHLRGDASGVEAHRRARPVGRGAQGRGRVASGPCCSDCERGAARAGMAPVRRGAAGGVLPKPPGHGPRRWTYLIRSGRLGEAAPDLRTMFSYESVLDDMAFIFSPSISIALAAAIAPVAGMVCGGVAFAVGVVLLCTAKSTEPHPGWSQAGAAGNDADIVDVADARVPSPMWRETVRPLRRARSPRGRLPSLRQPPCLRRACLPPPRRCACCS